jgi:hypothetical protein
VGYVAAEALDKSLGPRNRNMSKHLAFLLTCLSLLFGAYAAAAEYKTQQALDLVRQGTAMLNLASPDMPTYRLSATVRLTKLQTQDLVGTYVEQGSAGQQRSDLIVGDYKELYIQSQGKAWRSKSDRPLRVAEALAPLIPHSFSADPGKDWKLRLRESKVSGEKLQCVTAEPKNGLPAEWCFASGTKTLRRFSRGSWKYLYLDHQSFW